MIPARLSQRALARCIDFVILFLVVAGCFAGFTSERADGTTEYDIPPAFLVAVLMAVVAFEVVPVWVRGQTPGKMLTHIRVARVDDGRNPTVVQSLTRWAVPLAMMVIMPRFIGLAVILALAIVYGTALADRGGRSVLDKLSGTRVVQVG